jgi:hypothetical protein
MRLTSNIISRATQMKLIMQFGVGLEGNNLNYDNFDVSSILSA